MRVLFLPGYRYPASLNEPITCGDLRYSFTLSRALARAGASPVILSRGKPEDPDVQELDGVTIHRYIPELSEIFQTSFDISARRRESFRRLADDADVVVANSPLSLELCAALPCPLVYVCSGLEDLRNYSPTLGEAAGFLGIKLLRDPMKRATWKRAARVNTTAEREDATLVSMGVPKGKITAIGPGVELERYAPSARLEAERLLRAELAPNGGAPKRIILSVSRFTPAKGLVETLGAFARLLARRSDIFLLLVGVRHSHRAGHFDQVQRTIETLGLSAHVAVRENVPELRLPLYYALADVTSVFSVGYDPLPTVMIESMSCGTPVVSTRSDTRTQVIDDGETGLMVPEKDEAAWVSAVERLLDDGAFANRVRSAGLARAQTQFDANRVARQFMELFASL
jgi:glycosyltransferase involved in cell wall biosynthesis